MVRDYALAASGLLVRQIGGPSVKPYQPDGVWEAVAMIGEQHPRLQARHAARTSTAAACTRSGSGRRRRPRWRSSTPRRARSARVRRERTNTPLQALVTLNDPQFVEAARRLADRALELGGRQRRRAGWTSSPERLLARPLAAEETGDRASGRSASSPHGTRRHPEDAQAPDRGRRVEADRAARSGPARRAGRCSPTS